MIQRGNNKKDIFYEDEDVKRILATLILSIDIFDLYKLLDTC
jgi:hypothetical protein